MVTCEFTSTCDLCGQVNTLSIPVIDGKIPTVFKSIMHTVNLSDKSYMVCDDCISRIITCFETARSADTEKHS